MTTGQNVYVIEHEHGYVKIGVSGNPRSRCSNLQTACPYKLSVLGEIASPEPFATEARLHERFNAQQKKGEWYNLNTRQKQRLLALCDLDKDAIYWRYSQSPEERREKTLKQQALIG